MSLDKKTKSSFSAELAEIGKEIDKKIEWLGVHNQPYEDLLSLAREIRTNEKQIINDVLQSLKPAKVKVESAEQTIKDGEEATTKPKISKPRTTKPRTRKPKTT